MQDLVAVSVKNLTYTYKVSSTSFSSNVLDNISFSVNKGDLLGVIGPNGAGKTTLFSCMLGLFKDYQGEVRIFGHDIRKNNNLILQSIGYIPQQKSIEQGFPATVQEIVSLGLIGKKNSSKEKVDSALEMVDLPGQNHRRIGELSGGQQQRVSIARSIVHMPKILFADEPTANLDSESSKSILDTFLRLNKDENLTIVMVTHERDYAKIADRQIEMFDGKIIQDVIQKLTIRKKRSSNL